MSAPDIRLKDYSFFDPVSLQRYPLELSKRAVFSLGFRASSSAEGSVSFSGLSTCPIQVLAAVWLFQRNMLFHISSLFYMKVLSATVFYVQPNLVCVHYMCFEAVFQ